VPTFVAFLRAVNVGPRVFKMADVRSCLEEAGLGQVETYIQSGNLRFTTTRRSRAKVESFLESTLEAGCGFDVPAIVLTPTELSKVYDDAAAAEPPLSGEPRRYVMFLKDGPAADGVATVDAWDYPGERAKVVGRAVHVWLTKPTHEARFSNARFEKILGVPGTLRDLKVVTALAQRWGT
jgi:uncharacterized protein (DUF1697 family)